MDEYRSVLSPSRPLHSHSLVPIPPRQSRATCVLFQTALILVNSTNDRETPAYSACDYVSAILGSLRHYDKLKRIGSNLERPLWESRALVTHVVCLDGAKVEIDDVEVSGLLNVH